jgi:DNA-binding CsgD family transcriptional regulator
MNQYGLSDREEQVAMQLMEGKSNKLIALELNIAERTVEFHLKNIYSKLGVTSRVEAILKLREAAGVPPGDSTVGAGGKVDIIDISKSPIESANNNGSKVTQRISLGEIIKLFITYKVPIFIWVLLLIIFILILIVLRQTTWKFQREGEYPDKSTVGQVLQRSNASDQMVHGQFGTEPAWPPKPGYVVYENIKTPGTDHLYLRLHYSKYSASTENILVFLDDEPEPRAYILPVDQGDWDKFIWTDSIDLGSVKRGVHTLKFYTDGQEYGVADLDQFTLTLTAGAP